MEKLREMMISAAEEYTTMDILNMLSLVTGLPLSKTQINHADKWDDKMALDRQKLERWKEEKTNVYTADDFPDFIKDIIRERYGKSPNQFVIDAISNLFSTAPLRNHFVVYFGKAYFDEDGYGFVISWSGGKGIEIGERVMWIKTIDAFNGTGAVK